MGKKQKDTPEFDPSKPFVAVDETAGTRQDIQPDPPKKKAPPFDPNKPYVAVNEELKKKDTTRADQGIGGKDSQTLSEPPSAHSVTSTEGSTIKRDDLLRKVAQAEYDDFLDRRFSELQQSYDKQLAYEVSKKRNELDAELKSRYTPGTPEFVKARNEYEKEVINFQNIRGKELAQAYDDSLKYDSDKFLANLNQTFGRFMNRQDESEPVPIQPKKPIGMGPYGMTNAFGRSLINFFVNVGPKTIFREVIEKAPKNYDELVEKVGKTKGLDNAGILTEEKIKSTPLDDLLDEYKDRQEPAAKDTYNILKRAAGTPNVTPERVAAFYKDEVNRMIKGFLDDYKEKTIGKYSQSEEAMIGGITQDFTSIRSVGEFADWLGGSLGQGIASSAAFATVPAILYKMEKFDALDEIRAQKADALTKETGRQITPDKLQEIQSTEENKSDENLASTVGLISMGLEGLGFLATVGKAVKQVFKKQIMDGAKKYLTKHAVRDVAIGGGTEFATEYLQDIDQQVGGLVAKGMSITDAVTNVDHKRAFNAGMQGFAPGTLFGGITAHASLSNARQEIERQTRRLSATSKINEIEAAANTIQESLEAPSIRPPDLEPPSTGGATVIEPTKQPKEEGQDAIQKQSPASVLQREQGETTEAGSERGGVEQGVEGTQTTKTQTGEDQQGVTKFTYTPSEKLSPGQSAIEKKFGDYIANNYDEAKERYVALPQTKGGTILNSDFARELSEDYQSDKSQSAAVHEPASAFIKKLKSEMVKDPNVEGVEYTAGGTGAGKTTSNVTQDGWITYDGNLDSWDSAKKRIDEDLAVGKKVGITYTYRDPVEAFVNGVIHRLNNKKSDSYGRTVPLSSHVSTHVGSYENVMRLMKHYEGNHNVSFRVIDNSRGKGNAKEVSFAELPEFPYTANELRAILDEKVEQYYQKGEITKAQYEGFQGVQGSGMEQKVDPRQGKTTQQKREGRVLKIGDRTVSETTDAKAFHDAISKAVSKRTTDALQVEVKSIEDYQSIIDSGGKLFLSDDGNFGAFVDASGYMGSLFKNPESKQTGVAKAIIDLQVEEGGRWFDAFGTHLEDIYIKNGFRPIARMKFNEEYAPEGRKDTNLKGKPDLVFFAYDPSGNYKKGDGVYFDNWDDAVNLVTEFIDENEKNLQTKPAREGTGEKAKPSGKDVSEKGASTERVIAEKLPSEFRNTEVDISVPSLGYTANQMKAGEAHDTLVNLRKKLNNLINCLSK